MRQGIILLLAVISPIALGLWAIPGTDKYAKSWAQNLFKAILVYPIVVAIFAISNVLAVVLFNGGIGDSSGARSVLTQFAALIVLIAPLAMIPFAFKIAGGAMGAISGAVVNGRKGTDKLLRGDKHDPHSKYHTTRSRNMDNLKTMEVRGASKIPRLLRRQRMRSSTAVQEAAAERHESRRRARDGINPGGGVGDDPYGPILPPTPGGPLPPPVGPSTALPPPVGPGTGPAGGTGGTRTSGGPAVIPIPPLPPPPPPAGTPTPTPSGTLPPLPPPVSSVPPWAPPTPTIDRGATSSSSGSSSTVVTPTKTPWAPPTPTPKKGSKSSGSGSSGGGQNVTDAAFERIETQKKEGADRERNNSGPTTILPSPKTPLISSDPPVLPEPPNPFDSPPSTPPEPPPTK